ncbi:hypothetical protein D3C73_1011580 [compost metagenome]
MAMIKANRKGKPTVNKAYSSKPPTITRPNNFKGIASLSNPRTCFIVSISMVNEINALNLHPFPRLYVIHGWEENRLTETA